MIKFFRKIRKNLLAENRLGKYLLYAVGEIVLVMIGILLALQVSDWNQDRKNNTLVESYTENLIEDLAKDSTDIQVQLERIRLDSAALKGIEERISAATFALDTIYHIARYEYSVYMHGKWDYTSDTYEVLTSTGDIALLDKEIIRDLNTLFNEQEYSLGSANHTFDSYVDNFHSYGKKYPVLLESSMIKNGSPAADQVWSKISMEEHATAFNSIVMAKGDSYRLALRQLPQLAEKTNKLLAKLRNR